MPTFPFIQVEGAIALPRMRPLDRIPATFGREWMLTQPHFSLRAEIRALYAAIMRTVCLSADAFREACRWDLQHHFLPAAPVRPRATIKASQPPAAAKTPPHADAVRPTESRHAPSSGSHRLAGGACAIGGAALLAWIVASHTPHDEHDASTVAEAGATRDAGNAASQRLADRRAAHERTTAARTGTLTDTPQTSPSVDASRTAAPLPAQRAASATAGTAVGSLAARPSAARPDYAAANPPAALLRAMPPRRADTIREAVRGRASRERVAAPPHIENKGSKGGKRHPAHSLAPHRIAPPVTTHRTRGMDSEASGYSPRRPGVRQDEDYASIVTYAATHAAQRPANRPTLPADGTDWVSHVSQRRVTEVPDRFAK